MGCRDDEAPAKANQTTADLSAGSKVPLGPESSPVEPTLDYGWCRGHGVPESVCTRCDGSLIDKFKQAGDWCAEHDLPESQCFICNPEVEARWEKLNPANAGTAASETAESNQVNALLGPDTSPVEPTLDEGWCRGHGVPESVCTRCNGSLIDQFKQAGDWCAEHDLPESQCFICKPEVEARWEKLNPAHQSEPDRQRSDAADVRGSSGVAIERPVRLLTGANDALCEIENLLVRFTDPTVLAKAGIEVVRVEQRAMSATLGVTAEVGFDATQLTRVTSRVAGVVREVDTNQGDNVDAGQLLAVIDSPALGEAKSEYIERKQNLALAEADQRRIGTIVRGTGKMLEVCTPDASAADIRAALSELPVGESKARLLRAHAALQLARSEEQRAASLLEKQLNSERDYQAAQSALAAAEADFIAIREEIAFNVQREVLDAERGTQVAQSALDAAARRLHILGLSQEQISEIGTESAEQLSRFELRSPAAGTIIERNVATGEGVAVGEVLFVVADMSSMWLIADVYERELPQIRRGLPVLFTVDGMPGTSFSGSVSWISSQVDDRTRTVRVRANLPNPDGLLRANMFGQARIVVHENGDVLSVPAQAVQTDGCCQLVFLRESDTVFRPRKVALGAGANGFVEVLRGLHAGDAIASTGSYLLKTEILKSNIGAGCCEVDPGR